MRKTQLRLGLVVAIGIGTSTVGCGLLQPAQDVTKASLHTLKPNPHDYRDPTKESVDDWELHDVAGRPMRDSESDPDPLKNVLMSEKARSIERSLGVE